MKIKVNYHNVNKQLISEGITKHRLLVWCTILYLS